MFTPIISSGLEKLRSTADAEPSAAPPPSSWAATGVSPQGPVNNSAPQMQSPCKIRRVYTVCSVLTGRGVWKLTGGQGVGAGEAVAVGRQDSLRTDLCFAVRQDGRHRLDSPRVSVAHHPRAFHPLVPPLSVPLRQIRAPEFLFPPVCAESFRLSPVPMPARILEASKRTEMCAQLVAVVAQSQLQIGRVGGSVL
jgi:hypothetical protein